MQLCYSHSAFLLSATNLSHFLQLKWRVLLNDLPHYIHTEECYCHHEQQCYICFARWLENNFECLTGRSADRLIKLKTLQFWSQVDFSASPVIKRYPWFTPKLCFILFLGVFAKCRYIYYGKHSEGNRFIRNDQLWCPQDALRGVVFFFIY